MTAIGQGTLYLRSHDIGPLPGTVRLIWQDLQEQWRLDLDVERDSDLVRALTLGTPQPLRVTYELVERDQ